MESFDADVIIAGAGPAGTSAAFDLARSGIRVLILEKSQFPRYKVCGAGLTHKILKEIPYDITPVIETTIRSVRFSHRHNDVFTRTAGDPIMYCTMRDTLDAFMLEKATDAGASVLFHQHVTGVEQFSDRVMVTTKERSFKSQIVLGADGVSGLVARLTGLRRNIDLGLAWEAEVPADAELVKELSETVFLDWGTLPGGYAWMFPKKDHLSIGVGGPAGLSSFMMKYMDQFVFNAFGEELYKSAIVNRKSKVQSWPIPVRRRKGPFHNHRVMIAGDAAGLTDPMTGEGIWYAVKSGRMAAEAAIAFLGGQRSSLEDYSAGINATLMEELTEACHIRDVFNVVPGKIHRLVRDNDRVWRAFGKILRGERVYADVRGGFGRWKFLWGATITAARGIYFCKEKVTRSNH
jgi:geranylgeranyl reductase family protein